MHPVHLSIHFYPHTLDVRFELPFGCFLGVADVMSELRTLATDFTLCHFVTSQ